MEITKKEVLRALEDVAKRPSSDVAYTLALIGLLLLIDQERYYKYGE